MHFIRSCLLATSCACALLPARSAPAEAAAGESAVREQVEALAWNLDEAKFTCDRFALKGREILIDAPRLTKRDQAGKEVEFFAAGKLRLLLTADPADGEALRFAEIGLGDPVLRCIPDLIPATRPAAEPPLPAGEAPKLTDALGDFARVVREYDDARFVSSLVESVRAIEVRDGLIVLNPDGPVGQRGEKTVNLSARRAESGALDFKGAVAGQALNASVSGSVRIDFGNAKPDLSLDDMKIVDDAAGANDGRTRPAAPLDLVRGLERAPGATTKPAGE